MPWICRQPSGEVPNRKMNISPDTRKLPTLWGSTLRNAGAGFGGVRRKARLLLCVILLLSMPGMAAQLPAETYLQQRYLARPGTPDIKDFNHWLETEAGFQQLDFFPGEPAKNIERYLPLLVSLSKDSHNVSMPLGLQLSIGAQLTAQPIGVIDYLQESRTPVSAICPIPYIEEWGMFGENETDWYKRAKAVLEQFVMADPQRETIRKELLAAVEAHLAQLAVEHQR